MLGFVKVQDADDARLVVEDFLDELDADGACPSSDEDDLVLELREQLFALVRACFLELFAHVRVFLCPLQNRPPRCFFTELLFQCVLDLREGLSLLAERNRRAHDVGMCTHPCVFVCGERPAAGIAAHELLGAVRCLPFAAEDRVFASAIGAGVPHVLN